MTEFSTGIIDYNLDGSPAWVLTASGEQRVVLAAGLGQRDTDELRAHLDKYPHRVSDGEELFSPGDWADDGYPDHLFRMHTLAHSLGLDYDYNNSVTHEHVGDGPERNDYNELTD